MKDVFELTARYLIPSVRRHLARELVKRGMREADAARVLGLSRSAITRYVNSERGAGIELSKLSDAARMIEELATKIIEDKLDEGKAYEKLMEIASCILSRRHFCAYHKRIDPGVDISRCSICPTIFAKHPAPSI